MRLSADSFAESILSVGAWKNDSFVYYISSQNRLVRLTNHDHIAEADWDELCRALKRESPDYDGNIEELFRAELYLISPLREPERFYRKNIF